MAEAAAIDTPQVGSTPPPGLPNEFQGDDGRTYHVDKMGKVRQKGQGKGGGGNPDHKELACTPDEFLEAVGAVADADWPKHSLYVWRTDPVTDNSNGGRDHKYIVVQNQPVTEEMLKVQHGSGTYKLRLIDAGKFVAMTYITIDDPAHPPHCVPGDWLSSPRNQKWLPWKPSIEKWWNDQVKAMHNGGSAPADGAVGELTKLLARMMDKPHESPENQKLTNVLVGWALQQTGEQRKAEREADSPDKLTTLVKAIKELQPPPPPPPTPPPPPDNTMTQFLLSQVTRMQESVDKLTMKLIEVTSKQAAPLPVQDPIEQAKKMGELISTVASFANPAEPKDALTTALQEGIPRVIDATERFFSARAVAGFNRQPQPQPQTQPNPQTTHVPVVSSPPATPPTPVNTPRNGEPEMDMMQRTLLVNIARRAQSALDLGMAGDQFGEQMLRLVGEIQFDAFVSGVPKDNLLPLLKSVPEAWQMVQPFEPILPQFVDEFYEWALAVDEEEEQLPDPAPTPKPSGAKKKAGKK